MAKETPIGYAAIPTTTTMQNGDASTGVATAAEDADVVRDAVTPRIRGFDVDPIPGVHMYSLTVPMDHLGAEKKQCELVARMAVDEYNRRYKDDKGELKFGKIIKVMVKVVAGFIYYLTVEAINLSSEMPVTFQAVVFTGVSKDEVESFRFISDAKKEPWLWKDDDICTC